MVPVLLVALLTGPGLPPHPVQAQPRVCVVARLPDSVAPGEVDLEMVRRIFLVRQRFWPDGTPAHPVNLPAASPVRERFSRAVFGQGVQDLVPYWNDRYFHGTRPPPTMASEAALLLFVQRTAGSVGYVEGGEALDLPEGVSLLRCLPAAATGGPS